MTFRSALVFPLALRFVMGSVAAEESADDDDESWALGDSLNISRSLGEDRDPVGRKVLARELDYYEIRAGTPPGSGFDAR